LSYVGIITKIYREFILQLSHSLYSVCVVVYCGRNRRLRRANPLETYPVSELILNRKNRTSNSFIAGEESLYTD